LSSGGRAQRRRCRPLSSTSCWRSRPRLQGRPRLYSLGGRFYPRIPRLYGLHPVGSGRLVFADPDPHSSRLSIWVAEAASTSSGGLSQVAAVLAVLYSLASRLGLLLRQIRIQCYGSASKTAGSSWARLALLASEVGVHHRGTSPWPRLSSTASAAVESAPLLRIQALFLQQYLRYR